ncbi:MAG: T9SS type A sorting domain-containing protein [Candidatus Kapaibacterium sp.]
MCEVRIKKGLHPNPVENDLNIKILTELNTNVDVELFTLEGMKIFNSEFHSSSFNIDLSSYQSGYYTIIIKFNNIVHTDKILIHK